VIFGGDFSWPQFHATKTHYFWWVKGLATPATAALA
jgi:hypothetical protein